MLTWLRLNYGLYWRYTFPSHWRELKIVSYILLVGFGFWITNTYYIANNAHAMVAEARASDQRTMKQFIDFLNGGTIVSLDGHFAAKCERLVEVVQ